MKLHYYPETDSLYVELKAGPGAETREVSDGFNVDLDADGEVVGLDFDRASGRIDLTTLEETLPLRPRALRRGLGDVHAQETMTPSEMRAVRTEAGLTQTDLARFFRLADSRTVRRYETGRVAPSGPVTLLYEKLRDGEMDPQRPPAEDVAYEEWNAEKTAIGGLRLCEWAQRWQCLGILQNVAQTAPCKVGLYRAKLHERIVYVGVASEHENRGLRKRLTDYVRESDSGRKNKAGRCLHRHANVLEIDILITGADSCAAESARRLEHGFIFAYQPEWNFLEHG